MLVSKRFKTAKTGAAAGAGVVPGLELETGLLARVRTLLTQLDGPPSDLVASARALKSDLERLTQAAKNLPAQDMDVAQQRAAIAKLEEYIRRQSYVTPPSPHPSPALTLLDSASGPGPGPGPGSVAHDLQVDGADVASLQTADDDLALISPLVDGRLIDIARSS